MSSALQWLPVINRIAYPNIIATPLVLGLDLLVGVAAYTCVKRKDFSPVILWVAVCVSVWPCLIVLELCRSPNPEKTPMKPVEYFGLAAAVLDLVVLPLGMYLMLYHTF
ncbi:hypothetical protein E3E11_06545 [Oecophyllibacter saccharovorans]|uniref:hypothetical protein n=1 Tax=Oecophyllibacter saccharovorans TaxID=2558360 RepID=UPI0011437E62|nr:hypothetical protein [Oecophyllibacter saccharovorans]QDH15563.1 hypothetical protein E3E11_06545 [Oecophyllibacter saccharovorans]